MGNTNKADPNESRPDPPRAFMYSSFQSASTKLITKSVFLMMTPTGVFTSPKPKNADPV